MDTIRFAKIFKALSHPNRLELFLEIVKQHEASFDSDCECFVSDIMTRLNIGAPTVSHHLKELANADLITIERRGKYVIAKIKAETIGEVANLLSFQPNKA